MTFRNLFILSFGFLGIIFQAHASPLLFADGVFRQGGFIYGKVEPRATVNFGDIQTKVSSDGYFFAPVPRKANAVMELSVRLNGENVTQAFVVEPQEYKTQKINGIPKRKVNPNPDDLKKIKSDKSQILSSRSKFRESPAFMQSFIQPVEGYRISGVYGSRRVFNGQERSWHKGTDFAAPTGTPVKAPADAVVTLALADSFFNGNLIVLDHGHQVYTIYAHLDKMDVKKGDLVKQGVKIGEVGSTGRSTGPHLHWGLYWRNMALDPNLLLLKKGNTS